MAARNIPDDTGLPSLSKALDHGYMRHEFEHLFLHDVASDGDFVIEACTIEQARYKPGRNCLILYQLSVVDCESGKRHDVTLCGRVYPPGTSRSRYEKAEVEQLIRPAIGPALMHIPSLDMVVWTFPNERKLDGLAALANAVTLPDVVANLWGQGIKIAGLDYRILHYVPEHTCSIRVDLTLEHRATRTSFPWPLIGKTYCNDQGAQTYRIMQELQVSSVCDRGELIIPMPIAYQPQHKILWQETLPGRTLMETDARDDGKADLFARTGQAIGALHRTPVAALTEVRVEDLLARLAEVTQILGQARPAIRGKLARLVNRLSDQVGRVGGGAKATLHGDLHQKNIFVMGERVALIDLDNMAIGPPLHDIGSFVASLLYRNKLAGNDAVRKDSSIHTFVSAYRACVPWRVDEAELNWYTATALINERAFRCLSRLKDGRLELVDQLIDLADYVTKDAGAWEKLHHAA